VKTGTAPDASLPTFSHRRFRWFTRYLRAFYLRRQFTALRLAPKGLSARNEPRPTIVYTNHPSWWDPLVFMLVHGALFPGRPMYGPFDEKALEKYGFFRRLGAFGVDLESRAGAVKFLRTSRQILAQPESVLWITAQGRFADVRERPLQLRPGLAHAARAAADVDVIPVAVEYTQWDERLPEILVRVGEGIDLRGEGTPDYEQHLANTMDSLAADAVARDPERFDVLLDGRVGVGGMYDRWRRVKSWARGRAFDPAHGER
jgi:1-acyl-sn-glycerol-3-phosphate acyltransferase